jgi:hypothetical protein
MSDGQQRWTVRGVPVDLTSAVCAAATARGVTVGQLVTEALRAPLSSVGQRAAPDHGEAVPVAPAAPAAMAMASPPIPSPAPYTRRRAMLQAQAMEQAGGGRRS